MFICSNVQMIKCFKEGGWDMSMAEGYVILYAMLVMLKYDYG